MAGSMVSGVQLKVSLARRQPVIQPINDAASAATWSTIGTCKVETFSFYYLCLHYNLHCSVQYWSGKNLFILLPQEVHCSRTQYYVGSLYASLWHWILSGISGYGNHFSRDFAEIHLHLNWSFFYQKISDVECSGTVELAVRFFTWCNSSSVVYLVGWECWVSKIELKSVSG